VPFQGQDRQSAAMDSDDLHARVARLEERIETMKADLTATLEGFRADQAVLREDMAKHETRLVFYMIAIVGTGLAIFGLVTS